MGFSRLIDNSVYSRKALAQAREAFQEYCAIQALPRTDGLVSVTVSVKDKYESEARQVILEFWNYFLDAACQQHLESA